MVPAVKIHCVSVVRDEADILGYSLDAALRWAHVIHILDNGSTDGTWELLEEYAAREPRVVLAGRHEGEFENAIRGEVGERAAADARPGDWWCRLDADELYVDDPREILAKIPPEFGTVSSASIEYYFTDVDLHAYEADPEGYVANWSPNMMRYYAAHWGERRFVRYHADKPWSGAWPRDSSRLAGARQRVRLRHFKYRTPPQIERRVRRRLDPVVGKAFRHETGWPEFEAWSEHLLFPELAPGEPLWKSRVLHSDGLHFDAQDGEYVIDWDALPPVQRGR